ncbi:hypothetical protein [Streptomyces sp. SD31]|uniref:MinD/ParA family ATP-binding protein n=1 Tax=Streptomyces sp. SD31 TaxID=3452208 RepID=UPI003F88C932
MLTPNVVAVVSPHANTGKNTTTAVLGAILASERDDQVIAVDADDGTLGRYAPTFSTGATLRALAAHVSENGVDIRGFTSRASSGLEILADSAAATAPSQPLDAVSYSALLAALSSYGVVLSDCATGVDGLAAFVALTGADQQIFVSSLSESSVAATAEALATYRYLADSSHVVLTGVRDGDGPMLDARDAAAQLDGACRSVVIVPFDPRLAVDAGIDPEGMGDATWQAYRELAAVVAEGFPRTKYRGVNEPGQEDSRAAEPPPGEPQQGVSPNPTEDEFRGDAKRDGRRRPQLPRRGGPRAELPGGDPPRTPSWSDENALPPVPRASLDPPRRHEDPAPTSQMPRIDDRPDPGSDSGFARPGANGPQSTGQFDRSDISGAGAQDDWPQTGQFDWRQPYDNSSTGQDVPSGSQDPDSTGQFERPGANSAGAADFGAPRPPVPPRPPRRPARQEPEAPPPATDPGDGRTPLYDALETKWFHGGQQGQQGQRPDANDSGPAAQQPQTSSAPSQRPASTSWRISPNDELGRQAERARRPAAGGVTSSGLPRRMPRANLIAGTDQQQTGPQTSRAPEDVRGRLSNLRRGIARGRKAAAGTNEPVGAQGEAGQDRGAGAVSGSGSGPRRPLERGGLVDSNTAASPPDQTARPATTTPRLRAQSPPAHTEVVDELSQPHHLIAELAEQAAPGREIPLHVQITREPGQGQGSVRMRPFPLPEEGAQLTITVSAPGLEALGHLTQELTVYPGRDSDALYFGCSFIPFAMTVVEPTAAGYGGVQVPSRGGSNWPRSVKPPRRGRKWPPTSSKDSLGGAISSNPRRL